MGSVAGALCGGGGWGGQGVCLLMRPGAGLNDDLCFSGSEPSCCSACALRAYCARSGRDTHPRIPVTCLVARRSSKAHMRTTKLPSTWNCPYEQTTQPCKVELCRGMQDAHMFKWQVPHSDISPGRGRAQGGLEFPEGTSLTLVPGSDQRRCSSLFCHSAWLHHPCGLGGPLVGGIATSPVPTMGTRHRGPHSGEKSTATSPPPSRLPHSGESSIWLHHPCLLEVPIAGRNQYGDITPAFSVLRVVLRVLKNT